MKRKIKKLLLFENSVNLKEMTWIRIRIHFFPVRIQDHQN